MPNRPPLRSIEIFVAAGEALSFTVAADALGLTVSAVSRRIRALERDLATDLFRRYNRRVELTPAGAQYLAQVSAALATIGQETDALMQARSRKLIKLSVLQSFATAWLVPRLAVFRARRPDIDIELESNSNLIDFTVSDMHAGIRFGTGDWPGLIKHKLVEIDIYPVCAPALAPLRGPATPERLDRLPFLSIAQAPQLWDEWFAAIGLAGYRPKRVQTFDNTQILLEAAAAGMGLALCFEVLAASHLAAGRLVSAFSNLPVRSARSYYLVYRPRDKNWPPLRALNGALLS
jgi:LysR family glycine cleavage system transcriptional activator